MQQKSSFFFKTLLITVIGASLLFAFTFTYGQQAPSPDIRLGIRVFGGACGANPDKASQEIGTAQFTPWANNGGGSSPFSFNPGHKELHCGQVKLETRAPAIPSGKDVRFGVQLSDGKECIKKVGVAQYTPWASEGGGMSEWAKDGGSSSPGFDDPDCAKLIVETRDIDDSIQIQDIRLVAQMGNGSGKQYCTKIRTPFAEVSTPWASEGGGWSSLTGTGGTNPECFRVGLNTITAMTETPPEVEEPEPLLRVIPSSWRFQVGDTKDLEARYYPDVNNEPSIYQDVTSESNWVSENSNIVSVNISGQIQGLQIGNTVVHALYQGLDAISNIEVYFEEEPPIDPEDKKLIDVLREIIPKF